MPSALRKLAGHGFKPVTVFDVGAYRGDFARLCLEIWPETRVVAFEALESRIDQLRELAASGMKIQVVAGLLGATASDAVPFHEMETASSVLEEHSHQPAVVTMRPMRTMGQIVKDRHLGIPDLLKLDVQGYELEVLKGAEDLLHHVSVIVAEVNFLDIHRRVPLVADVVSWLHDRDWVAYDICGITRRPLDHALWQADLIFVRTTSVLRSNKNWS
jgi:FkbM family methyltransferase